MTEQTMPHPKFSDPAEEFDYFFKLSGLRERLSFEIWRNKYRLVRAAGATREFIPADTHRRVAEALYEHDPRRDELLPRVIADMNAYRYIPGGRILAGAGARRQVTLLNCFVNGAIEDSMPGIMQGLTDSALTLQQGGGIGNDFSTLRPKDALVMRTESGSSGPLGFMTMWDAMSATIESAGARRGAMMATLADWHPDLPAFIAAKQKPGVLRMFNVSVLVSDAFIQAVRDGKDWDLGFPVPHKSGQHIAVLDEWPSHAPKQWNEYRDKGAKWHVYHRMPARELWNAILESTYRYAEPGVIFIDRVNHRNPLGYCEEIRCTNPCFTGDTRVWTSGGHKTFSELAATGKDVDVLTVDSNGNLTHRTMRNPRQTRKNARLVEIAFRTSPIKIRCTPNHEFHTPDGRRIRAANLKKNDLIHGAYRHRFGDESNRTPQRFDNIILSVRFLDERTDVYCGTVDETHKFFVGLGDNDGVLVSNCGEQPLPPWNSCNLGAINASRFILDPFTENTRLDEKTFAETVTRAVRTHDNVIDASLYPLPQQREQALLKRRIGLGFTGVANALQKLRLRYGSPRAVSACEAMAKALRDAAYRASIELAKERGSFPTFDRDQYLATPWAKTLPGDIRQGIREHGIRNGVLLTVAPTGTTSTAADNVSSGIEPTFSFAYTRNVTRPDGGRVPVKVLDAGLRDYIEIHGEPEWDEHGNPKGLPDYMATAQDLTVGEHLKTMAAFQRHIDASISKTINCPESMSFGDFKAVYDLAYKLGCKGCTTYRPDPIGLQVRGAILETLGTKPDASNSAKPAHAGNGKAMPLAEGGKRPDLLTGATYKIKWQNGNIYVTINNALRDGKPWPYEMFVSTTAAADRETCETTALLVTALLRQAADPTFIFEHLAQVQGADGGAWVAGRHLPSRAAAVAHILKKHFAALGLADENTAPADRATAPAANPTPATSPHAHERAETCPKCAAPALVRQESCKVCMNCSYTTCG